MAARKLSDLHVSVMSYMRMCGYFYKDIAWAMGVAGATVRNHLIPGEAVRNVARVKAWRVANPERKRENSRRYYLANREEVRERSRKHYLDNKDRHSELSRLWKADNKERYRELSRKRRAERKDEINRQRRARYLSNPGPVRASNRARRLRGGRQEKYNGIPRSEVISLLIERDGMRCGECGDGLRLGDTQIDHVKPVSVLGSLGLPKNCINHIDNLQLLHPICNQRKGARI